MKIRILAISVVALLVASCIVQQPAKGPVEDYNYAISGEVKALSTGGGVDVIVDSTLDPGRVRVRTNTDVIESVEIYTENSTLHIKQTTCKLRPKILEVYVPAYDYRVAPTSHGVAVMCQCLRLRHRVVLMWTLRRIATASHSRHGAVRSQLLA